MLTFTWLLVITVNIEEKYIGLQIVLYEWQSEYNRRRVNSINWAFGQNLSLLRRKEHHHLLILKLTSLVLKSINDHSSNLLNYLELDSTIFVWWWWCLFLEAALCVCIHINHHIHIHKYIDTVIYWILIFPLKTWKSIYLPKISEYAEKLDLIGSLFSDSNCNIVEVAGYPFPFPSLLTLKSSAQQKQKFEIWDVVITSFLFSIVTRIFIYSFCISELQLIGLIFSACQMSQQYSYAFPAKVIKNKTPLWVL